MDNLEEMDKLFERHNIPRLNQEEIENMKRAITSTEIETVIKIFQQVKIQDHRTSQVNSMTHLEKNSHNFFSKHSNKIAEEGTFPSSFCGATITLIPKPTKISQKKKITGQ